MTCSSRSNIRYRLDETIKVLCPMIEDRVKVKKSNHWKEYELRKELVGCILGSQVRHEMAVAAMENIEYAGLLDDIWWLDLKNDRFDNMVFNVLSGKCRNLPNSGSYRFPKARAKQLTDVRYALAQMPIEKRLKDNNNVKNLRKTLVKEITGLGPKQASMFLRNIGASYELAILDTHVLRFMDMQQLLPINQARIATVSGYEKVEQIAIDYADKLGYPAGYLDWAIWATMKAAREIGL